MSKELENRVATLERQVKLLMSDDPWPELTEKKRRNHERLQQDVAEAEAAEASRGG